LNYFQNGFLKNKYTVTISVTHLDYFSHLVTSKCQEVVIYSDRSTEIDLVMHFIIFKLSAFSLPFCFLMSQVFP